MPATTQSMAHLTHIPNCRIEVNLSGLISLLSYIESPAVDRCELEHYLHEHIQLSQDMGVEVVEATWGGVTLQAPLAPTINHRETVFGGSASAAAFQGSKVI
jgi:hypothetical protein